MVEADTITRRFQLLAGMLDERARRISRRAIQQGIKELLEDVSPGAGRVRRVGGGRKKTVIKDPSLSDDLERIIALTSQGGHTRAYVS